MQTKITGKSHLPRELKVTNDKMQETRPSARKMIAALIFGLSLVVLSAIINLWSK